jgi:hypothetical protein
LHARCKKAAINGKPKGDVKTSPFLISNQQEYLTYLVKRKYIGMISFT